MANRFVGKTRDLVTLPRILNYLATFLEPSSNRLRLPVCRCVLIRQGLKTLDAAVKPLRLGPRTTQTASMLRQGRTVSAGVDALSWEPCHA
jgi:hypothetical protein